MSLWNRWVARRKHVSLRPHLLLEELEERSPPASFTFTPTSLRGDNFQSHNQKIVYTGNGIFRTGYDGVVQRSTNGGQSFSTIHNAAITGLKPPTVEADGANNIYVVYPESASNRTRFLKFSPSNNYAAPVASRTYTQASSDSKFASAYDSGRGVIYHATQTGHLLTINATNGDLVRSQRVFTTGSTGSRPSYPHLFVDRAGTVHYALTVADAGDNIPYETIRYLKSVNGGQSWQTMGGTAVSIPTTSDPNGPSTMINLPGEVVYSTWLANMHAKDGKVHFTYQTRNPANPAAVGNPPVITPHMHYMRFNGATGAREVDSSPVGQGWLGDTWRINAPAASFASDPDDPTAPLFAVGGDGTGGSGAGDGNRIVALVSYDNGDTWHDHARSASFGRTANASLARHVTPEGRLIGGVATTNPQWATTNFFRIGTDYVYFDAAATPGLQGGNGTAEGTTFAQSAGATLARVPRVQGEGVLFKVNSNKIYDFTSATNQTYGYLVVGNANQVTYKVTNPASVQTFNKDIIVQGASSLQWDTANLSMSGVPALFIKEGSTTRFRVNDGNSRTYDLDRLTLGAGNNRLETLDGSGTLNLRFTGLSGNNGDVIALGAGGAGRSTLTVNNASSNTFGGVITGTGRLTKTGAGNFQLTGANTYTGTTTVTSGTLSLGNGGAGGSLADATGISLGAGGTLQFTTTTSDVSFGNALSGSGRIVKWQGNEIGLTGTNTFSGTIDIRAGKLAFAGAGSANGVPSVAVYSGATLSIGAGFVGGTAPLGNLSGAGLVDPQFGTGSGTRTLQVNQRTNGTFSGTMQDATSGDRVLALRKTGPAMLTLSGVNTYSGPTRLDAGELRVSGLLASGLTTVAGGAVLSGSGSVGAVVNDGTVSPTLDSGRVASFTFNGDYTQNPDGALLIDLGGTTPGTGHDVLQVNGSAVLSGLLDVSLVNGFELTPGTTFDVVRADAINLSGLKLTGLPAGRLSMNVETVGKEQVLRLTVNPLPGPVAYYYLDPGSELSTIVQVGSPLAFFIYPFDASFSWLTAYAGTVYFWSPDPLAVYPDSYTFTGKEGGIGSPGTVTFGTLGIQELYVWNETYTAFGYAAYEVVAGGSPGGGSQAPGAGDAAALLAQAVPTRERATAAHPERPQLPAQAVAYLDDLFAQPGAVGEEEALVTRPSPLERLALGDYWLMMLQDDRLL